MVWIDEIISGILETYRTNDPYELCDELGIYIFKLDPSSSILAKDESIYFRKLYDHEVIFIRDDLPLNHERFYIRHELGHAILHPELKNSYNKNLINKYKLEKQANYFAFKLTDITFDEAELHNMTLEQIASCIGIPYAALKQLANFFNIYSNLCSQKEVMK